MDRAGAAMTQRTPRDEVLQGTLQMLVLKALSLEPMHGWGIAERLLQWSEEVLRVNQGSLDPTLYQLEHEGMISSRWKMTENSRRARYYTLTAAGRRRFAEEQQSWTRASRAVNLILAVQ
jgi:PadR family transcriptional regulator, regulatory protein PadR